MTWDTLFKLLLADKTLVIFSVTAITIICLVSIPDKAETIVTSAFTGLFGVAVGMGMRRQGDTNGGLKPPT